MEDFGNHAGFGGDEEQDLLGNPYLPDQLQINDYYHIFANPSLGLQGHDDLFRFQNPTSSSSQGYLHESLDECFGRMNLNQTWNANDFGSSPMFRDGFNGRYLNSTTSLGGQTTVQSVNPIGSTFIDDGLHNVNCFPFQNPLPIDVMSPSMHNRQRVINPNRPCLVHERSRFSWSWLRELRGKVCQVAKDQNGCRFLQEKLENPMITGEEIEMIFMEVKDQLHALMVHRFGNYLIQYLSKAADQVIRTQLLFLLVRSPQRFLEVCTDIHGSRTIQKVMECITTNEQRCMLLSSLKPIAFILINHSNGHHVIQQCLYNFSHKEILHFTNVVVAHCIEIATNKSGCCLLQEWLVHVDAKDQGRLLDQIIANALLLSENEFGAVCDQNEKSLCYGSNNRSAQRELCCTFLQQVCKQCG
ncbi:pumilio homolog 11-like [Hibiscus syriacus]|uniref:pumilio homolog 11-like n=1 Tax=Hibiscus syriacus TaxID=106335 RepID=UPI0019245B8B|nr:pumilio homolog 11-like [Hibiscus syriacus]